MHWNFTPYAVPLFIGAGVMIAIMFVVWQRRARREALIMEVLILGALIYVLGYALEVGSTRLGDAQRWLQVEYIGITTVPVLMFLLAIAYTGYQRWLNWLNVVILAAIPAMTLVFAWTNDHHHLIWQHMALRAAGDRWYVDFDPGSWYWVHILYSWLMMMGSILLLVRAYRRTTYLPHRQIGIVLAGFLIPVATVLLYLSNLFTNHLDLNAYGTVLSSFVVAWGLFSHRIFDIVPVAREAVLDGMIDAVIIIDAEGRLVDLNAAAQQLAHAKYTDYRNRPAVEVFPELLDVLIAYRDAPSAHAEIALDTRDQPRFFDIGLSPLHDQGGKQAGYLLVLRDISARVRAETALTETNLRLMTLRQVDVELNRKLDVHYVADIAIDAAMRVTLGDAALIGLKEEDGIRIIRALGPYPPSMTNSLLENDQSITARVIQTQKAEIIPDVSQVPNQPTAAPSMRAQISVPLLSGRKVIGAITVETTDPTRFTPEVFETLKLLAAHIATAIDNAYSYQEREKLVKELEAFSRTVAHDLKNPLSSVIGYAELAVDNYDRLDDTQKKSFLEIILRNGQKSVDIINALLLLARVRRDQEVQLTDLNTTRIVEEVRSRLQPMIDQHHAELFLPDSWPVAVGYAPWVEEIWANYISNAIKYGGSPPRVVLGGDELPGGKVRFWVRDNGGGLSKDDQAKLFRVFTRLGQSDASGHGLGLSIVQSIAERLKGGVGVESEIGKGSLFYFTLPAGGKG